MKIALLLPNISISGGVHVALSHARALLIRGHEITLIDVSGTYGSNEIQVAGVALNVRSLDSVRDISTLYNHWNTAFIPKMIFVLVMPSYSNSFQHHP